MVSLEKNGLINKDCTCKIKVDTHKSVGVYFYFTGALPGPGNVT